ncbi:MAG TPA: septal ring lytic transglycosylase RlpA family protein [Xanthobacteraceae bacterium]|jgi:rare lipoprotein A
MLWIIIHAAALCAALASNGKAEEGTASKYDRSSGKEVACGGSLDESSLTAAHKTLPCGSRVRVTNRTNGKSVVVTINDRGPFVSGRIIDLSPAAARAIGMNDLSHVSISSEKPARGR